MPKRKKWGKIGSPKSKKRREWLKKIRRWLKKIRRLRRRKRK